MSMDYVEYLPGFVDAGMTTREIAKLVGKGKSVVSYHIRKLGLADKMDHAKPRYVDGFFRKIDTAEKAYILGFLAGDGDGSSSVVTCSLAFGDRAVLKFIAESTGANYREYYTRNERSRTFPKCRICIGNRGYMTDLKRYFGGLKKTERHLPRIPEALERFMILGFFDADGCLTWGHRKDSGRLWHKALFTSTLPLLTGVQNILLKWGIATAVRPKVGEDCFVLEFASRELVKKFLDTIYPPNPFIMLQRKYRKAAALRLEWGENGEA